MSTHTVAEDIWSVFDHACADVVVDDPPNHPTKLPPVNSTEYVPDIPYAEPLLSNSTLASAPADVNQFPVANVLVSQSSTNGRALHAGYVHEPSSTFAPGSKFNANGSVHPGY